MSNDELGNLVVRVRGEFTEMPGLQLTLAQASRLFGLTPDDCHDVLDALVRAHFLRWEAGARIARVQQ